jgi:hypothetical protein
LSQRYHKPLSEKPQNDLGPFESTTNPFVQHIKPNNNNEANGMIEIIPQDPKSFKVNAREGITKQPQYQKLRTGLIPG